MDPVVRVAIRALLDGECVLTAAVVVDGEPVAALLPYVLSDDYGTVFVHASSLARHSRGLVADATVSLLVHRAVTAGHDPMQVPRLTVQAIVTVLERRTPAWDEAAARLVSRFPAAATTLALEDFQIYALVLGRGRYVEGFARAYNVGAETFRTLGM